MAANPQTTKSREQDRDASPALILLVVLAFLFGGASRPDVATLLLLRPISAVLLIYAIYRFGGDAWRQSRWLVGLAVASLTLVFLHLIPLPPSVWGSLPGREVVVEVYQAAGHPAPWLPLSMSPQSSLNALFSLFLPFAALILALASGMVGLKKALFVILILAFFSGLIGLLQILGSPNGPLYFYKTTNNGAAVGLFANRNHHAMMLACVFPLLAVQASLLKGRADRRRFQILVSLALAAFLPPLILVTGSRSGLVLGAIALVMSLWVYRRNDGSGVKKTTFLQRRGGALAIGTLLSLSALTIAISRGRAFERLIAGDNLQDLRFQILPVIWEITKDTFPWGTGFGVFDQVFRIYEPTEMLSPRYVNQAHNDWLQLVMNGGLPAVVLMAVGISIFLSYILKLARDKSIGGREKVMGRCAVVVLISLAAASVFDYPLRTPSLVVLTVICAAVLAKSVADHGGAAAQRDEHE